MSEVSSYKRTPVIRYQKLGAVSTDDAQYWSKLQAAVTVKEFGAVTHIHACPVEPHYFAVSCSARVQVYNPINNQVYKNLNKFTCEAFGGTWRQDGRLLAAGTDDGELKLFDVEKPKSMLRVFKTHTRAVHRCSFPTDQTQVVSFSDDKTIQVHDIPAEKAITTITGHTDYIRAGAACPGGSDLILSGSYDHSVRIHDGRTSQQVMMVDHGDPVEDVLWYPSGGICVSAGGCSVRVWDVVAGGRLLAHITAHHKTITSLGLAMSGKRLVSAGLDKHMKFYDVSSYSPVQTLTFPSPVLSFDISAGDKTVMAGMSDGLLSIQHRQETVEKTPEVSKSWRHRGSLHFSPAAEDQIVSEQVREKYPKYDKHLRKFEFSKALDAVLIMHNINNSPDVIVSVLQELIRRERLKSAIAGREGKSLAHYINFISRYIGDIRFSKTLIQVAETTLDVYQSQVRESSELTRLLTRLQHRTEELDETIKEMMKLSGAVELVMAGADHITAPPPSSHVPQQPSHNASLTTVLNIDDAD